MRNIWNPDPPPKSLKLCRRNPPGCLTNSFRRNPPGYLPNSIWRQSEGLRLRDLERQPEASTFTPTLTPIGIKNHKVQKIEKDFQLLVHLHWEYIKLKNNIKLKLIRLIRRRVPRKSVGLIWSKYSPKVSIKMDLISKNFKIKSRKRDG